MGGKSPRPTTEPAMWMHNLLNPSNLSHMTAVAADGRWLGQDYVLALLAATFPAWTLYTLVGAWLRAAVVPAVARKG